MEYFLKAFSGSRYISFSCLLLVVAVQLPFHDVALFHFFSFLTLHFLKIVADVMVSRLLSALRVVVGCKQGHNMCKRCLL